MPVSLISEAPAAAATQVLSDPSNAAPIEGGNEALLAEARAKFADGKAPRAPQAPKAPVKPEAEAADPADQLDATVAADEAQREGLSWDEAMRRVPPGVAKLMKGMQADYTKKTQELAAQRKELQRERESLAKIKFEVPEVGEYDPFDESSVQKRIEAEVAKKMKLLLEPMQQEAELLRAESDYQAFLAENPDFKTDKALRSEVQALLESNPQLDLETAYLAVQGKRAKSGKGAPDPKAAARKTAAKEAAAVVATPRRGAPQAKPDAKSIRTMSTADILELAKSMHRAG